MYWDQRYSLFSRFDHARVDATGLHTMVPERLALDLARRAGPHPVVDACCGIGAMSIAFARTGRPVVGIEIDPGRLDMARHNARIYGVSDRIDFRQADASDPEIWAVLPERIGSMFLDPPWGEGPGGYRDRRVTRLADLAVGGRDPVDLAALFEGREVLWRLPPNFDIGIFRDAPGEKIAYVTRSGYLHFYFVRIDRDVAVELPRESALEHDGAEARVGFLARTVA